MSGAVALAVAETGCACLQDCCDGLRAAEHAATPPGKQLAVALTATPGHGATLSGRRQNRVTLSLRHEDWGCLARMNRFGSA